MVTVKYHDLSMAFAFVSSAAAMENHAYVSLDTGAIYWVSERDPIGKEELPDDLEGSDHYIEIPRKNDLELGNDLALRFVRERLPDQFTEVRDVFHQRGAYTRFKHFLSAKGRLEEWYRSRQNQPTERYGSGAKNIRFNWSMTAVKSCHSAMRPEDGTNLVPVCNSFRNEFVTAVRNVPTEPSAK